tara:strand:- start:5902 stop:6474 length:573 start_codon:yes stop_codon:yes gene_type:complete
MKKYFIIILLLPFSILHSQEQEEEASVITIDFDSKEELYLNFSFNAYRGVPVYTAKTFEQYDRKYPVYGLSIGTPLGFQFGFTYTTLDFEIMKYKFESTQSIGGNNALFEGIAYQVGINSGFFINAASLSVTAATGIYHKGNGFVGGLNIDLPYWGPLEVRGAVRFNTVQRPDKDYTGWIDIGISLGYEL